jgi:hypothetical protein
MKDRFAKSGINYFDCYRKMDSGIVLVLDNFWKSLNGIIDLQAEVERSSHLGGKDPSFIYGNIEHVKM